MKKRLLLLFFGFAFICLTGCVSGEVGVREVAAGERLFYGRGVQQSDNSLMASSTNVLGNFLLNHLYEKEPQRLLEKLEELYLNEPQNVFIETLADCSHNLGRRLAEEDPDLAARYYLSSVYYSWIYLVKMDKVDSPYDPARLCMMRIYNLALTELLSYLSRRNLERSCGFELTTAAGQTVFFSQPAYSLAVPQELIREIKLCADYRPLNLTHESHRFGIGVPLILPLSVSRKADAVYADRMVLPATAVLNFEPGENITGKQRLQAKIIYADSRNDETIDLNGKKIPLEQDLSTPLAYMAKDPLPFNFLFYMLRPDETQSMQGLYHFEAFDPRRIPIVLVHGLMSDSHTWLQMINTLRSDPVLLKRYQIYGFSYSSGNPFFFSAMKLCDALSAERERIVKAGLSTENFDKMVLVGHSMGGLVSRVAVSRSTRKAEEIFGKKVDSDAMLDTLSEDQRKMVRRLFKLEPLPFVKRVVFIAVPHRGSDMASSWIGRFGSWCIRLPGYVLSFRESKLFAQIASRIGHVPVSNTGIANLDPDSPAMHVLAMLEIDPAIPYHSIIGNRNEAGVPGGSDGVVPYSSSHMEKAVSELVVQSGHSAQKNPLAIQELRRILYLHLKVVDAPEEKR